MRQGIPIVIRNSRHPDIEGTLVGPRAAQTNGVVKSIPCITNVAVVHLSAREPSMLRGISDGLNDLFERNNIPIHMVQGHANGIRLAVSNSPRISDLLREVGSSVAVTVEEDSALVSLVGNGVPSAESVRSRALQALSTVRVRMISQGCGRSSISFAVPASDLANCVERLHREFFRMPDAAIFAATPESARRVPETVPKNPQKIQTDFTPLTRELGSLRS